jgi:hypothetical protein
VTTDRQSPYRNRVVEFITVRAGDLVDNDGNWRVHPLYQRSALEGRLESVGITDVLKLYRSARAGGRLVVIDGHLRKSVDADVAWPAVVLDLTDEEADDELAFHDAIGGWAEVNPLALQALLDKARADNEKVAAARARLSDQIAEQVEIAKRALGDPTAAPARETFYRGERLAPAVKVTVAIGDDLATVERALRATGLKNRGAALGAICSYYVQMHGGAGDGDAAVPDAAVPTTADAGEG